MVEVLVFAVLSVYLFYRLWSVLGTRTGNEKQRQWVKPEATENDNIIVMPQRKNNNQTEEKNADEISVAKYSDQEKLIKQYIADFTIARFEKGARNAFETVIKAFADSNTDKLINLVGEKVYKSFEKAIQTRQKQGNTLTIEINNIESEIIDVSVDAEQAKILVRFISDQLITTKDKAGEIIENVDGLTNRMVDVWTFAKELTSKGPVWLLIKTESIQ
jgi:predicted lipid-binding transport protein (Tim44 family)